MTTTETPWGTPGQAGRATRTGDAEDRAEVARDGYGRYLLPFLDGRRPPAGQGFTRVSTTKSELSNQTGIRKWEKGLIADGFGARADLVAQAAEARKLPEGDARKQALRAVADTAFVAAGGKDRSGKGTALHEITEKLNRGDTDVVIPDEWRQHVDLYMKLLADHDITVLPEYLERQVLCRYNHAGTFDNIVRWYNPETQEYELVIADLKTGRSLELAWLEILMQLWFYATAYAYWTTTKLIWSTDDLNDPKRKIIDVEGFYTPMPPELRTDRALIFHVPLDGTAELFVLDLSGVHRFVEAALESRRGNAESKFKVRSAGRIEPAAFTAPASFPGQVTAAEAAELAAGNPPIGGGQPVTTWASPAALAAWGTPSTPPAAAVEPEPLGNTLVTPSMVAEQAKAGTAVAAKVLTEPTHDPVTGRKKRTCGICHESGHQRKNCPQNPDSPKYDPSAAAQAGAEPPPADPAAQAYAPEPEPPTVAELAATVGTPEVMATAQETAPYCLQLGHTVCQWTAGPDGKYVCSVTGKPSRAVWENRAGNGPVSTVPASEPEPPAEWGAPGRTNAQDIAEATTPQAVLVLRAAALEAGTWTDADEAAGHAKYWALSPVVTL